MKETNALILKRIVLVLWMCLLNHEAPRPSNCESQGDYESRRLLHTTILNGDMAQLVAQRSHKAEDFVGSNPTIATLSFLNMSKAQE
jgi:hypothetical protein